MVTATSSIGVGPENSRATVSPVVTRSRSASSEASETSVTVPATSLRSPSIRNSPMDQMPG